MNDILGKLSEYLEAAEGLVIEYAPEAAQLVLMVVQMEAVFDLVLGFGWLGASYLCYRGFQRCSGEADNEDLNMDERETQGWVAVIFGIFCPIMGIISMASVLSFYNWLAAFNPLAGLVYKLIN